MVALTPILALGALIASTLATPLQVQFPEVGHYAFPSLISASTARTYLADLKVVTPSNNPEYDRTLFKYPIKIKESNNCTTREVVLKRDGNNVISQLCTVASANWVSPYDNFPTSDPSKLQIDHVVPLKEAWISGARDWDDAKREEFANDLTRPQLLTVSARSNGQKGASDPSAWLPDDAFKCTYVVAWIQVKRYYNLTISLAEKAALRDTLATYCGR